MSELDLVNDGRLTRKIIDNRVYVCIYQAIHVCCPDRCREYLDRPDGVCPITGLYHGQADPERSYIAPEKRTAHVKAGFSVLKRATPMPAQPLTAEEQTLHFVPQKHQRLDAEEVVKVKVEPGTESFNPGPRTIVTTLPESGFYSFGSAVVKGDSKQSKRGARSGAGGRKKPVPASKRRDDAELIVTQLLYSNVRRAINREKKERLAEDKFKAIAAYYKDRAAFPIMVEVEGLAAVYDVDIPALRDLKRDETRIEYYVGIILRTWDIVTRTPWGAANPGYKFVAHALSVLYKMRSGMTLNNLQLLPYDSYLNALPHRGDLHKYDRTYSSSIVTEGTKHIRAAYESALQAGWSPNALSLDTLG